MSKREVFIANQKKIDELNEQANSIRDASYKLEVVNLDIIPQLIEEEQILNGTTWELKTNRRNPYLEYYGSKTDACMIKLTELAWDGYHSSFTFEKGIDMEFDDVVSLQFDDLKKIPAFVKRMGIIIEPRQIKENLQKLKKDALVLEIICHQLQLVV